MKSLIIAIIIVVLAAIIIPNWMFIVDEREQAVVIQFGKPLRIIVGEHSDVERAEVQRYVDQFNEGNDANVQIEEGPGLKFKLPFLQTVRKFDDRLLEYDSDATDVVTGDKKTISVDNFARWKIINPLQFLQSVRTEQRAQSRLDDVVFSVLREELAKSELIDIVRSTDRPGIAQPVTRGRQAIMEAVTAKSDLEMRTFGIKVLDVRIKRADLPQQNEQAVFGRMIAERQRISKQYRSEGEEEARKITAETDRQVTVIKALAYKEAETLRGDGDSKAAAIYAAAYTQNEKFYEFSRSLETLEKVITPGSRLIISTEGRLFSHMK